VTQAGIDAISGLGTPDDATLAYILALNLGLSLRERGLDAVAMLGDLVAVLETAAQSPDQDDGGPLRVLAMLYVHAPPWPVGPGDLEAALDLLQRAVTEFPSHPANHLFYAVALLEDGEREKAAAELQLVQTLAEPALWGEYAVRWRAEAETLRAKVD
jgi:tetratricopeptide (TPR) repeat protein